MKIALDLGVYPRAVNDRVSEVVRLHFIDRERLADHVLAVAGQHALVAVDAETKILLARQPVRPTGAPS